MQIVITDGYELNPGDLDWQSISKYGEIRYYDTTSDQDVSERCKKADIIITNKTRVGASQIRGFERLKLIAVTATGYNNIDIEKAKEANISVCNVPEYGTFSVAQHTFALLLELVNRVGLHAASVQNEDWEKSGRWSYSIEPPMELKDKLLGIVGLGRIGLQVAELGRAFGMKIIFSNRSAKTSHVGKQVSTRELFASSDVISLHCPLTAENAGFVNEEHIAMMKPSAFLINTSRGQLINENDLAEALRKKKLSAAALDVLSAEPPPHGHPLMGLPNCIITPHNAWSSFEARTRLMEVTSENIRQFLEGKPQNIVSR
jgi:glycerate dehydrogenase